ncbi:putative proline--tRNA ligase, mitochondrial [Convolutriloba macropyga]|uniref:putative proline--tRNA ligase, mitochondrial n=1 Tax=Convolutriloba macropyga TaxID=536237 RepID=UPI003F51EE23
MSTSLRQLVCSKHVSLMSDQLFYLGSHALRNNREVSMKDITCMSHKYMTLTGMIQHCGAAGLYSFSPPLLRSVHKLSAVADKHMRSVRAQKLSMPSLCPLKFWSKSGRDLVLKNELITLQDKSKNEFCLSPTFEALVTFLVANNNILTSQLPLSLYQIGPKFRDEPRPKHGLLRCREFLMKDMYSFHKDLDSCREFYEQTRQAYRAFFEDIGLIFGKNVVEVQAPSGAMGGSVSHEYHVLADIGEDTLHKCSNCATFYHPEVHNECPCCSSSDCREEKAIEVGHTFILGKKYSHVFNCIAKDAKDLGQNYVVEMGCYGLGLSRILAAYIESFFNSRSGANVNESGSSKKDANFNLNDPSDFYWHPNLAPYKVSMILPKTGNKEEAKSDELVSRLNDLSDYSINELIIDDRDILIGKKLTDAKFMGTPYIMVLGRSLTDTEPKIELIDRVNGKTDYIDDADFLSYLTKLL